MFISELHKWDILPKEGVELQRRLRGRIKLRPLGKTPEIIAGADVSYDKGSDLFFSGVVLMKYPEMTVIEEASASARVTFPYVPGLLSFREGPIIIEALKKLKTVPHIIIFDGQGIAHPRGIGIASHLGLFTGVPAVGCAKTKLCGDYEEPGIEKGASSPLYIEDKEVGAVVRSRTKVKPLFVSPGHLIGIRESVRIVLKCCGRFRQPEPTRQAHILVNQNRLRG